MRRRAIAALVAALPVLAAAQEPSPGWTQFRGDARLSGIAAHAPADRLTLRWTFEAPDAIESSAAIADGTVYVGASSGDLLAVDLETGKLRWKYATGNELGESSPAVAGGLVYIGDLAGVVHAVHAQDGSRAWTFKTNGEVKSSPTIVDGIVLIGSYDTHLYALDGRTGAVRWKLQTEGPVHATPAVQNGLVYLGGCDERFRVIRAADGKLVFQIPLGGYTGASTLVSGERAYVGTFNQDVVALDLKTRRIAWRYRDPEREFPYYSSAAMIDAGARRIVVVGGRDKAVHGIDAASGKSVWKFVTRARVDS